MTKTTTTMKDQERINTTKSNEDATRIATTKHTKLNHSTAHYRPLSKARAGS